MTICRKTSFDELYSVLCVLVAYTTGIPCWRKMGIQAQPNGAYATVYLMEGPSPVQDVVEQIDTSPDESTFPPDPSIYESPVGLTRLDCRVEFFRNVISQPALDAAIRFRNSLQLQNRFYDLWEISGLVGEIRIIDVSAMFRADVEGRAEVRFSLYADVSAPHLPGSTDNCIYEIDEQGIVVYRNTNTPPPVANITISKEV